MNALASRRAVDAEHGRIGPKISSCITALSGLGSTVTVGATKRSAASTWPPTATVPAPLSRRPWSRVDVALVDDAAVALARLRVGAVEVGRSGAPSLSTNASFTWWSTST